MKTTEPIYTAKNVSPAYQLNWGLTVFWRQQPVADDQWLALLQSATEPDHARIHKIAKPHHYQLTAEGRRLLPAFINARAARTQKLASLVDCILLRNIILLTFAGQRENVSPLVQRFVFILACF